MYHWRVGHSLFSSCHFDTKIWAAWTNISISEPKFICQWCHSLTIGPEYQDLFQLSYWLVDVRSFCSQEQCETEGRWHAHLEGLHVHARTNCVSLQLRRSFTLKHLQHSDEWNWAKSQITIAECDSLCRCHETLLKMVNRRFTKRVHHLWLRPSSDISQGRCCVKKKYLWFSLTALASKKAFNSHSWLKDPCKSDLLCWPRSTTVFERSLRSSTSCWHSATREQSLAPVNVCKGLLP